jgi:hypothetical protein
MKVEIALYATFSKYLPPGAQNRKAVIEVKDGEALSVFPPLAGGTALAWPPLATGCAGGWPSLAGDRSASRPLTRPG